MFGKVLVLTYRNYLIRDTPTSSYLFRILIPKDLRDYFGGRTSFKVSLRNGIKNECLIFSKLLYLEVQSIFKEIRMGKDTNITLKQIQEILRDKIERTILHSRHFVSDTNTFVESEVKKGIDEVDNDEELLKTRISDNYELVLEHIEKEIDGILRRKDLSVDKKSLEFKELRKQFLELRLVRNQWKKELLCEYWVCGR